MTCAFLKMKKKHKEDYHKMMIMDYKRVQEGSFNEEPLWFYEQKQNMTFYST